MGAGTARRHAMNAPARLAAIALLAAAALLAPALGRSGGVGAQVESAPSFPREAFTYTLDEGEDGSGTAIAVGRPVLVAGAIPGGTDACAERASGEFQNPSADPASFIEAGDATATASSVLGVAADCAITYTGSGATRVAGALEAYSLTVDVSDGVDASGNADASVDDTIKVTVMIVNADTDRAALEAFYDATGGDGWANRDNWKTPVSYPVHHTFRLTAAMVGTGIVGYDASSSTGAIRESSGVVNLGGSNYTLTRLTQEAGTITFTVTGRYASGEFGRYHLALGSTQLPFGDATLTDGPSPGSATNPTSWAWTGQTTGLIATGDFEAALGTTRGLGSWAGVTADGDGRVTGICPAYCHSNVTNRLTGVLPPELGHLSQLTSLRIEGPIAGHGPRQAVTGAIPPEIGALRNLTRLEIAHTDLSGPIPPEIGRLSRLTWLEIEGNPAVSGPIPPEFGALTRLRRLYLDGNDLSGAIPELGALTSLRYLYARDNRLSDFPLAWPTGVRDLRLSSNAFTGRAVPDLSSLTRLVFLWLDGNGLTGFPSAWPSSLWDLYLQDNDLTGFPDLRAMTSLETLHLQNNRLSGAIPAWMNDLASLRRLRLDGNADDTGATGLTGSIPDLSGTSIRELWLADNRLSGTLPATLAGMSQLTDAFLDDNEFTGDMPAFLNNMANLAILSLAGNRLTGTIPDLSGTRMWRLILSDNRITGLPAAASQLGNPQYLILDGNRLSGSIPDLSALTNLERLDLHGNRFTGSIPATLGQLTGLKRIDLHGNRLTGVIPDLSALTGLERLALRSNQLSGGVPAWLGDLTALTHLDLGANGLSGNVPLTLHALEAMVQVRLRGNQLSCADHFSLRGWLADVRAKPDGIADVAVCPQAPAPAVQGGAPARYGRLAIAVAAEGPAPEDAAYAFRLDCDNQSWRAVLAAGERVEAPIVAGALCALTVTDAAGAIEVRGLFANQLFGEGVTPVAVTLVHAEMADEDDPEETPAEDTGDPVARLDGETAVGGVIVQWRGGTTPVADAVSGLTLRVTAIHQWDPGAQRWRSWFPDGDDFGVNAFTAFEPRGFYFVFAEERETAAPEEGDEPSAPEDGDEPSAPEDGDEPSAPGDGDEPSAPEDGDEPSAPGDGDEPSAPGGAN